MPCIWSRVIPFCSVKWGSTSYSVLHVTGLPNKFVSSFSRYQGASDGAIPLQKSRGLRRGCRGLDAGAQERFDVSRSHYFDGVHTHVTPFGPDYLVAHQQAGSSNASRPFVEWCTAKPFGVVQMDPKYIRDHDALTQPHYGPSLPLPPLTAWSSDTMPLTE